MIGSLIVLSFMLVGWVIVSVIGTFVDREHYISFEPGSTDTLYRRFLRVSFRQHFFYRLTCRNAMELYR